MAKANQPRPTRSATAVPSRASEKSTCSTPPQRKLNAMLTEKESKAICYKLLGYTKADDAQVSVNSEDFSHLRFAANGFTTSGRRENATAHVTVWIERKRGSASANSVDDASLKMAVEEAERLARISPVDKEYVPTLGPQRYKPVGGFVESTVNVPLTERARDIDQIIRS